MQIKSFLVGFSVLSLVGCGSLPEERALSGSALGAGAGAALGAMTGMTVAGGALLGAAAGALTGALTDQQQINLGEPVWKQAPRPTPLSTVQGDPAPLKSQVVNSIQTSLNRLGYAAGAIDGVIGIRTQTAIRAYQRDHSLLEDGRASPELADHLWSRGRPRSLAQGPAAS